MAAGASINPGDVTALDALARRARTSAAQMSAAAAPLRALANDVSRLIGGTATGKDREFAGLLAGADAAIAGAVSHCLEASGGLSRAAAHAQELMRQEEENERRRVESR